MPSTWFDAQVASLHVRADLLEVVQENADAYIRGVSRRDAIAVSLRCFSAGIALAKKKVSKYPAAASGPAN